ncbi:MAG: phospho-sugar mutase [Deltaproteobacteria bacterium]|jgi:phosphomannomutase
MTDLFERVAAYVARDVDEHDAEALTALLTLARDGDEGARADLEDRFAGPLAFGTAGLRGLYGAGETRMNRATVIRATYGLVTHVLEAVEGAAERGIVIGRDGRHGSEIMARDAAAVCAARGVKVWWLEGTTPTPVVAFGVKAKGAAAGIVVTASHNPPEYNGYKVYFDNGAQIIPPTDAAIAAAIEAAPASNAIELAPRSEHIVPADDLRDEYLEALDTLRFVDTDVGALSVAYSAMHGVGQALLLEAFERRGFGEVAAVPEQAEPNGDFPTVRFPNPEEPGALDLVLALAKKERSDVVLVNDPDADRLGTAVRVGDDYRVLSGNEIGALLAHHVLTHGSGEERLFVTTVVSSQRLRAMANAANVAYAETLTGFKWITNRAMDLEAERGLRFAFGYEEALGYTVGTVVRDKDGIGAALVMAELAAFEKAKGRTLADTLADLDAAHGAYVGRQKSITLPGRDGAARIAAAMTALRAMTVDQIGEEQVEATIDYLEADGPKSNVLLYDLAGGGRVAVRPSGTEPKLKLYLEIVEADAARATARLDAILADLLTRTKLND